MKFSISTIITARHNAPLLSDALDSALSQRIDGQMEIIVVDDGSNAETVEVVSHYLKRQGNIRIQYVRCWGGTPAQTRNAGIQAATGRYIAFLDAEDVWLPGKLRKTLSFLRTNPDIGFLFTDFLLFDKRGMFVPSFFNTRHGRDQLRHEWKRLKDPFRLMLRECVVSLSTCVVRSDCFKSVGLFNEELLAGDDLELFLRLSAAFPVACLPEVLTRKRSPGRNDTGNRVGDMQAIISVLERMESSHPDLMRKHRAVANRQLADVHSEAGYRLFENKDFKLAFGHSLTGLRYRPRAKEIYYAGVSLLGICLGQETFSRLRGLKRTFSGDIGRQGRGSLPARGRG